MARYESEFAYSSRRSMEEAARAINAVCDSAALAHRQLSLLHSARALFALSDEGDDSRICDGASMRPALQLFVAGTVPDIHCRQPFAAHWAFAAYRVDKAARMDLKRCSFQAAVNAKC